MKDLDAVDGTGSALGFDPVTNAERTEQQNQHAAGEVRQAALQGQADGQGGGTNRGNERRGCHADHRGHVDHQHDFERNVRQVGNEVLQRQVSITQCQQTPHSVGQDVNQPPTDGQGDHSQQKSAAVFHDHR